MAASHLPILLLKIAKNTEEDSKFHATGQFLSRALKENITTRKGVGIDISRRMVEIAASKFPRMAFVVADAESFDLGETFGFVIDAGARTFPESDVRYAKFDGASADSKKAPVVAQLGAVEPTKTVKETETPEPTKTVKETETPEPTKTVKVTETISRAVAGAGSGTGSISGSKWHDLDGDHKWDKGEPTLSGWMIYLEMQEENGSNWLPMGSDTTDANGRYSFSGLAEGHYRVYEVVLLDPPYDDPSLTATLDSLFGSQLVGPKSTVVVQCSTRQRLPADFHKFHMIKDRHYGDTSISFYRQEVRS